jgi:hypothetical protein
MATEPAARAGASNGLRLAMGLALVAVVGALLMPGIPGDRSSVDRGPGGSAALRGVLERMGLEVESMRVGLRPLSQRPVGSVLVVALAPGLLQSPAFSAIELRWVEQFVESGSTLILVADRDHALLVRFGIEYLRRAIDDDDVGPDGRFHATAVLPEPQTLAGSLSLAGRGGLGPNDRDVDPLFAVAGAAVVVRKQVGAGWVFVVSDPHTISNAGIGEAANLVFYSGLIAASLSARGVVMFDDLHAGAGTGQGVVAYARKSGFLPSLMLILLLLICALWRAGSRLGAVLPAPDRRSSRGNIEMVYAVGSLYDRAGLVHHALDVLARRLRRRVEHRAGVPWDGDPMAHWIEVELGAQALEEARWLQERFVELHGQSRPAMDEVLHWARRTQEFPSRWFDTAGAERRRSEP